MPLASEKAAVVRAMFDRIAPRYDTLNRLLSFRLDQGWRREAIAALSLAPTDVVIDLACGTGDLSELAVHTGARVVGVDFSANMLAGAQGRRIQAEFVQADASCLPFKTGWATAVVSGFALRNFVSIPEVLKEVARVVALGGRVAFLEVDTPRNRLLKWGHQLYFNHVVPVVGAVLSDSWAYAYLPRSTAYLPEPAVLRHMFEAAGFHGVSRRQLFGGIAQLLTATK
ncbi:MAG: ubiquinone/menaquinone biosynthesis methyltransferase [Candidatus Binatia bacterium]